MASCEGEALDSFTACPPLTVLEQARFGELRAKGLAPERAKARNTFIQEKAKHIAARTGVDTRIAARVAAQWTEGVLLPDVELAFDDPELAGTTVSDILRDPARYEGSSRVPRTGQDRVAARPGCRTRQAR